MKNIKRHDNIINYVRDYQFSFIEKPFNDVDALIFSELAYYNFSMVSNTFKKIRLKDLDIDLLTTEDGHKVSDYEHKYMLIKEMMNSIRFKDIEVSNFLKIYDEDKEEQYASVLIHYKKIFSYVSYRGTDLTVYGWKEDFNLSFSFPLSSHIDALNYLNSSYHHLNKIIYVGGHSKGGNLAVYAGIMAKKRLYKYIKNIYSFDGPGFKEQFFKDKKYIERKSKIIKYVPEFSIFGMIMEESEDFIIVNATGFTIMEHIVFNWVIKEDKFDVLSDITSGASVFDDTINKMLCSYSDEDKKKLITTLYNLLIENDIVRTSDIKSKLVDIFKTYSKLDKDSKDFIKKITKKFLTLTLINVKDDISKGTSRLKNNILVKIKKN